MKFGTTALLALLVVTNGFVPDASVKKGSQLYNYRVSKWAPQSAAVASKPRQGPSMAELAQQWSAQSTVEAVSPAPVSSAPATTSPKKNYSGVKWSPNGSTNSAGTSSATSSPAVVLDAPLQTAAAVNSGVKKNYAPTKWSPQSGASPTGAAVSTSAPVGASSSSTVASPPAMSYGGMPKASPGPKGQYSPSKWQPNGGSAAPVTAAASASFSAPAATKKKDYSMAKWSPRGGSSSTGSGWAPPAVDTSSTPSAYSAPAAVSATSAPRKNYSGMKWSPRG